MLSTRSPLRRAAIVCSIQNPQHRNLPSAATRARQISVKAYDSCRNLIIHQYTALHWDFDSAVDSVVQVIMPRERGDARDAALMTFSVALFCVLGAQMYGIYMHWYFATGLRPILSH